jgi:tRNA U34 5-methylaminomethyl-2-thiouridine-forming methyltransferase MnmC
MKSRKIYMIVAVPGSGKTWVSEQLKDKFDYVHHDGYIGHIKNPNAYVEAILETLKDETSKKPVLIEAPFSISKIKDPIEQEGWKVTPVFILEHPNVLAERYMKREGRPIPKGHLTRMGTYAQRAKAWKAFTGTSAEVLEHLKKEVS